MNKEILKRLQWIHGGDAVEYEFWQDPKTSKIYNVPIETVRDFDNAEEVGCAMKIRGQNSKRMIRISNANLKNPYEDDE